jgi:ribosomal protein S27AE
MSDEQEVPRLHHECPRVGRDLALPAAGQRSGRLVPCEECGTTIFRADAWDDCDDDIRRRLAKSDKYAVFIDICGGCATMAARERAADIPGKAPGP